MLGIECQQQEQFKLALTYLLRAMELNPKDEEITFQYGLTLAQCDHIQDAASIFQDVLEINPKHSDAHYNLGVIAIYDEDLTKALQHFEQALANQPDHILAANGKKQINELLNHNDK